MHVHVYNNVYTYAQYLVVTLPMPGLSMIPLKVQVECLALFYANAIA